MNLGGSAKMFFALIKEFDTIQMNGKIESSTNKIINIYRMIGMQSFLSKTVIFKKRRSRLRRCFSEFFLIPRLRPAFSDVKIQDGEKRDDYQKDKRDRFGEADAVIYECV